MVPPISKAVTVIREEGYNSLIRKMIRYSVAVFRGILKNSRYRLWQWSGTRVISINNIRIHLCIDDFADCHAVSFFENNEIEMASDLIGETSSGDIIWDIGANFGIYTCLLQKVDSADVIAFEPFPENKHRLEKNLDLNGLDSTVLDIALSNTDGDVKFGFASAANKSLGGTRIITNTQYNDAITVQTRKADNLDLPQPSIVKIDVEGAEMDVIDGMENTLQRDDCRLVYCEIHHADGEDASSIHDYNSSPEHLKQKLECLGFNIEIIEKRSNQTQIKARK